MSAVSAGRIARDPAYGGPMTASATRAQVLAHRARAQQLDRDTGGLASTAALDIGVQDTGPDGGRWALATRGVAGAALPADELVSAWTIRGAPHLYRRADLPAVAAAVEPFSDADAGRRIYDAAKPLRAAGIGILDALDAVAAAMRSVVTAPMVKGAVSTRLTALMDEPYLRYCRPCDATHLYEQAFRLAALRAGLELAAGTSPPVLRPLPGFHRATEVPERLDVVRAYLRLLGPATPKHVADYLDAPVRDVRARWPADAVEVSVEGQRRWMLGPLADDVPVATRLLGPYDLFLQARDRSLLVSDPARAKALWPVLGRPGVVLHRADVVGMWRPRKVGRRLAVLVEPFGTASPALRAAVEVQAGRLAAHRGVRLSTVDFSE